MSKTQLLFTCIRLALGLIFIVAGVSKLIDVTQFVNEVASYGILPFAVARVYAIILPWAELVTGCALIFGLFVTPSLVLSAIMTLSFAAASGYALTRGANGSCACFGQLLPLGHSVSIVIDVLMIMATVMLVLKRDLAAHPKVFRSFARLAPVRYVTSRRRVLRVIQAILAAAIVLGIGITAVSTRAGSRIYSEIFDSVWQNKPVFLYFYLEGCVACDWQGPIVEDLRGQFQERITFILVDSRNEAGLALELDVNRVPAMLLIVARSSGGYQVVQRFGAFTGDDTLRDSFQGVLDSKTVSK